MPISTPEKRLLLFGASRGLGLAIAEQYLKLGWRVVATVRNGSKTALHDLVGKADGRLDIETVDINDPAQVTALRGRLGSDRFDLMFVNPGVTNDDRETIADVSTEEFVRVMVTNALSPMRVVEGFQDLCRRRAPSQSCRPVRAASVTTRRAVTRFTGPARPPSIP